MILLRAKKSRSRERKKSKLMLIIHGEFSSLFFILAKLKGKKKVEYYFPSRNFHFQPTNIFLTPFRLESLKYCTNFHSSETHISRFGNHKFIIQKRDWICCRIPGKLEFITEMNSRKKVWDGFRHEISKCRVASRNLALSLRNNFEIKFNEIQEFSDKTRKQ